MRISYKFGAIIFILINLFAFSSVSAQYKYSIDIKERKTRKVPLKYRVTQAKQDFKLYLEIKKRRRVANRVSRVTIRHTYRIQTAEVKRRMRKSKKRAENHNKGRVPLIVKFKKLLNG